MLANKCGPNVLKSASYVYGSMSGFMRKDNMALFQGMQLP